MEFPKFERDNQRWDSYRRFHQNIGQDFVLFDTGEMILTRGHWDPTHRRVYEKRGFQVIGTGDTGLPTMIMPEGTTVKAAWLAHHGQQLLFADLKSKKVVGMEDARRPQSDGDYRRLFHQMRSRIPASLRSRAEVYFAGSEDEPVGYPVRINRPIPPTPEERVRLRELQDACRAWCGLKDIDFTKKEYVQLPVGTPWTRANGRLFFSDFGAFDRQAGLDITFERLPDVDRVRIAARGFAGVVSDEWVDHLRLGD